MWIPNPDPRIRALQRRAREPNATAERTELVAWLRRTGQTCSFPECANPLGEEEYNYCERCEKAYCDDHHFMTVACDTCQERFCCLNQIDPQYCADCGEDSWLCHAHAYQCYLCQGANMEDRYCSQHSAICHSCNNRVCRRTFREEPTYHQFSCGHCGQATCYACGKRCNAGRHVVGCDTPCPPQVILEDCEACKRLARYKLQCRKHAPRSNPEQYCQC